MHTLKDLEEMILKIAPDHIACEDAPNTMAELLHWYHSGSGAMPVYSGASDKTIWSSPEVNYAFRAWHDMVHIMFNYDFSFEGEISTARTQIQQTKECLGTDKFNDLLWCDIAGQVGYFAVFNNFPEDQKELVFQLLANGVRYGMEADMLGIIAELGEM